MIRQPTPPSRQMVWWREALNGNAIYNEGIIHCGWFKARSEARGQFVPARIWLEQSIDWSTGELTDDEKFAAEIGDTRQWDVQAAWQKMAQHPITLEEHRWLTARMYLRGLQKKVRYQISMLD